MTLLVVGLSGCGGRDTSSLKSSIIGHWEMKPNNEYNQAYKNTHFYISKDRVIQVDDDGTTTEMKYKILNTNNKKNTIMVKFIDPSGDSEDNILKFPSNKERNKLVETINVNGVEPTVNQGDDLSTIESKIDAMGDLTQDIPWKFVDDKQKP